MTATEKWNSIVTDFQNNQSLKEEFVQKLWEDIFSDADMFGYSKRSGEIDIWRNIQIGSHERTIPDIIIRDSVKKKDLFVVELKQLTLPFNQSYKEQLFSYMRLLDLQVGILICNKIYIYVRENFNTDFSVEIPFVKNNALGEIFIELFSKGCFNQEKVKKFICEVIQSQDNIQKIKQDIQQLDLKELLIAHFALQYNIDEIQTALSNLHIIVEFKPHVLDRPELRVKPKTPPIKPDDKGMNKSLAIKKFSLLGYSIEKRDTTFASKNGTANNYWANPDVERLQHDWYLILNDVHNKKLYLFFVPSQSIASSQLLTRNDKPEKIDLQITYCDSTFTDSRSGYSFAPYLKKEIDY